MRDFIEVLKAAEGYFPKAKGGTDHDDELRQNLVRYANVVLAEIENKRRWALSYLADTSITTVAGTRTYTLPAALRFVNRIFYNNATDGVNTLELHDIHELRREYGSSTADNGIPVKAAITGRSLHLFPTPDNTGPQSGNYNIRIDSYTALTPIVETLATTTGASATITVPSTVFLTSQGVATSGSDLSIRGAGELGPPPSGTRDTWVVAWTAFPTGTTVTAASVAPAAASSVACYFYSTNWLITRFPKVLLYGMLRDVAHYLKADYERWEARYQHEVDLLEEHDAAYANELETLATAHYDQGIRQLGDIDVSQVYEIRGGT